MIIVRRELPTVQPLVALTTQHLRLTTILTSTNDNVTNNKIEPESAYTIPYIAIDGKTYYTNIINTRTKRTPLLIIVLTGGVPILQPVLASTKRRILIITTIIHE